MRPASPQARPATLECEVLRAFRIKGEPVEAGKTVTLPYFLALDLRSAHKVRIIERKAEAAPADTPTTPETPSPAPDEADDSKEKKGGKNAR